MVDSDVLYPASNKRKLISSRTAQKAGFCSDSTTDLPNKDQPTLLVP